MANERKPSDREQPDDEPMDEWDDLLDDPFDDDDDVFEENVAPEPPVEKPVSRPVRSRKQVPAEDQPAPERKPEPEPAPRRKIRREVAAEEPAPEPERPQRKREPAPAEKKEFRPEDLEGAERTKDGLIRVKEGAEPKKPAKDEKKKEPWLKSLGLADYIGLAASLAILVGLAATLLTWMYGQDWGEGLDRPDFVPEVPAAGNLFKVTSIDSYWRRRVDTDRAHESEIIIPEVTIEVEAVGSDGFLSVLFQDPSGAMSADAGNLRLSGGQLSVGENEGRQDGPNRFTFTSTKGFTFEPEFRSYISLEQKDHWTIEIVETKEYGGSDSKRLAYFEIAKDARTREEKTDSPGSAPAAE
ncbi:MAG: hypothetical protein R3F19_16845 [Verrucomicrobiales bacterium]